MLATLDGCHLFALVPDLAAALDHDQKEFLVSLFDHLLSGLKGDRAMMKLNMEISFQQFILMLSFERSG